MKQNNRSRRRRGSIRKRQSTFGLFGKIFNQKMKKKDILGMLIVFILFFEKTTMFLIVLAFIYFLDKKKGIDLYTIMKEKVLSLYNVEETKSK